MLRSNRTRTILIAALLTPFICMQGAADAAEQELRLANILADNMVLPRDKPITVWGWAAAGAEVKVTVTEDATLAEPIAAKAPKDGPYQFQAKGAPPLPDEGQWHATVDYKEHNAKPFATAVKTARAGDDGAWEVTFAAMPASFKPKYILAESNRQVDAAGNVLVGILWLNTGQSNIERRNCNGRDLEDPSAAMPGIRYCKLSGSWYKPKDDLDNPAHWLVCSPQTTGEMPGVSYYFALNLHRYLNVPVGIINNARGGTTGQAWCSREELESIPGPVYKTLLPQFDAACKSYESAEYRKKMYDEAVATAQALVDKYEKELAAYNRLSEQDKETARPPRPPKLKATKILREPDSLADARASWSPPAGLFNAVVYPLRKLPVDGMLYYQGENNNFGLWSRYELTLPRVPSSHRALFNNPEMPIGIIGLPGWKSFGGDPEVQTVADGYAIIRDIQDRTTRAIDGVDLIACYDLGGQGIHPGDKRPVGERSARWALARVYRKQVHYTGPIYREMKLATNRSGQNIVKLYFDLDPLVLRTIADEKAKRENAPPPPVWMTLPMPGGMPNYSGFIIAGKDRRWYPADVIYTQEPALEASSPFVSEPVAVRYAWGNRPDANAVGRGELPLLSFRTDDWPLPESWKYDPTLQEGVAEKLKEQTTAGRSRAMERKMAQRMMELSQLDTQRYLGKADRSASALLLNKVARISAVIEDIKQAEVTLFARRGGNPQIDKELEKLEAALKQVEAEIGKLDAN